MHFDISVLAPSQESVDSTTDTQLNLPIMDGFIKSLETVQFEGSEQQIPMRYNAVDIPVRVDQEGPVIYIQQEDSVKRIVILLIDVIGACNGIYLKAYEDIINLLVTADASDKVDIYIDTPGGDIIIMTRLMTAIKRCKAEVTTISAGSVMSAGAPIWLSGHKNVILDSAIFMFHFSSHSDSGSSLSIFDAARNMVDYISEVIMAPMVKAGLITADELERVMKREEIYVDAFEMRRRIENVQRVQEYV